ncbi:MAG TPA: alpha/beta fold hydrolase [Blastocatellia bacterium]|nr:alpha/beta fold hydrolase [Blastocatellia bacterium]
MKKLKINDIELAYRAEGSGQPIVFLHAFPLNQTMWDEQVAEFSSTHRVIALDWRGFGETELGSEQSSLNGFADDLASLLDHLKIKTATICGLSMGGYAAFAFYRKYSDRVAAMILCDTRASADTEEGKQARHEMAELARQQGTSPIIEAMIPRLLGETSLRTRPQTIERVKKMIKAAQPEGIAQALLGMALRDDSTTLLSKITCPTLIIVGSEDKLTPPSDAEKMHLAIAGSHLRIINNAGHLANLEEPTAFNQAMHEFLNQLS